MQRITTFMRANDGVTAVEFALISPVLVLLVMGILEISLMLFAQTVMEGAAYTASRVGKTGYISTNATREETIIEMLNQRMRPLFNPANISFDTLTYNQFDQIGQAEPFVDVNGNGIRDDDENYSDVNGNGQYDDDMGASGVGSTSQIVVYVIEYAWPVTTPIMREWIGEDGTLNLSSRTIIQNEPF